MATKIKEFEVAAWLLFSEIPLIWALFFIEDIFDVNQSPGGIVFALLLIAVLGVVFCAAAAFLKGVYVLVSPRVNLVRRGVLSDQKRSRFSSTGWWIVGGVTLGILGGLSGSDDIVNALASGCLVGAVTGVLSVLIGQGIMLFRRLKHRMRDGVAIGAAKKSVSDVANKSSKVIRAASSQLKNQKKKQQIETSAKYDNLLKLKRLLDEGVLSQDEFDREKERIMAL